MMADPFARRAVNSRIQSLPQQPPHSIESEQSVLGGLMLKNEAWHDVADLLSPQDFYRTDHQVIYSAITEMIGAGKSVDFVTLSERLRDLGKLDESGGPEYLASLATDTYSVANLVSYAEIVRERSVLRGLIAAACDIGELAWNSRGKTSGELLDEAEQKLFAIQQRRAQAVDLSNLPALEKIGKHMEAGKEGREHITGLATGFIELDHKTQGLHGGDMVIVAARPGKGKTCFACNIAEHAALMNKIPVGIFSMEMTRERLLLRFLASHGRIELGALRSGRLSDADFDRYVSADASIRHAPIHIDETAALSPLELRARARRMVAKLGVRLIIVDYLQLMQVPGSRENRTNDVSEISRQLKAMAKDLNVPVIALSQLSREVDKRVSKRPALADLRESGQIEADADIVLFIHRDENDETDPTKAEIIIGKHRDGPTGDFPVQWIGKYSKFDNRPDPYLSGIA